MRDGVRLATDLYLPANPNGSLAAGRFPALLTRTPYSKSGSTNPNMFRIEGGSEPPPPAKPAPASSVADFGRFFASRGYVVVMQDVRGRFKSEGRWRFLADDGRDGADTCAWIAAQPWSDGQAGTYGTSYPGGAQHAIALEGAPALKTAIPVDAVSNARYHGMRNGGALELRFWNWMWNWSAEGGHVEPEASREALRAAVANRRLYLEHLPTRRGATPLKLAPEYEDWQVESIRRGPDDSFWDYCQVIDNVKSYQDIPVYLVGGWYDSWGINTTGNYRALSGAIRGPVYLIMGPWIHGQQGNNQHGQVFFGPDAAIGDPLAWRLQWFDRWLKGADNAVGKDAPFAAPVRIFVMGSGDGSRTAGGLLYHGGFWRDEQEWPPARAVSTPFFLRPGGGLSTEPAADATASTAYAFDPADPVPTIGGNLSSADGIALQGAWDQRGSEHIWNWKQPLPLSARRDVLVFQTEPLPADLEVTGELEVRLWASSSAPDTDFTAKLVDVYPASEDFPNGFDLNLEDGIIRARFRQSLQEKLLEAGQVYEFTIRLYPTSNIFKAGHRIRLDISSSNFPRFDVNPNTGEPLGEHRRHEAAINTVYHDAAHPSRIILPVIPAG
jgi:putative CocE/NonD family hydrolase